MHDNIIKVYKEQQGKQAMNTHLLGGQLSTLLQERQLNHSST